MNSNAEWQNWNKEMNLNKRIENLENKHQPGNGVTAIELERGETEDHAKQRHCAANGISVEKLDAQSKLIVYLVIRFRRFGAAK